MGGVALIWSSIGFGFFTLPVRYSSLSTGVFCLAFFLLTVPFFELVTSNSWPLSHNSSKRESTGKEMQQTVLIIFNYLGSEQEANQFMIPGTNWDLKSKSPTVSSSKENEKTVAQDSKEKDKFTQIQELGPGNIPGQIKIQERYSKRATFATSSWL